MGNNPLAEFGGIIGVDSISSIKDNVEKIATGIDKIVSNTEPPKDKSTSQTPLHYTMPGTTVQVTDFSRK